MAEGRTPWMTAMVWVLLGVGSWVGAAETLSEQELAHQLATGARPEADKARDAGRKPAAVVSFLGIERGSTVVDLVAAGGYYTEVLCVAVGPEGKVYAQNGALVLRFRDGINDKALTARLADGRLPNVERLDRELGDLGLAPGSIDAALTALNFHDVYNRGGGEAAAEFLGAVYGFLRPGGVLGIIDHAGGKGDDRKLHRIDEDLVREAAERAGFRVEAASDVLRNPDDDREVIAFDREVRGRTDRFLLRLRKPSASASRASGSSG